MNEPANGKLTAPDALFVAPEPAHPDEAVAREEIARYYTDRLAEADERLTQAQDLYRARLAELDAWNVATDPAEVLNPHLSAVRRHPAEFLLMSILAVDR